MSGTTRFWPCLLEKAVAKLVGAYYRIDGGFTSVAMEMLTGKAAMRAPATSFGTHLGRMR